MPNPKPILAVLFLLLPLLSRAQEQDELVLTGVYNGKNLYVQNPLSSNMKDYCTREVWVNDKQVFSNPRSSAYTVNLSQLPASSPVTIRIVYSSGCAPKIINPQVIYSRTNFRFLSINIDSTRLEWVSSGEQGKGKFFVEKQENDRWQTLKSVDAAGVENSRYEVDCAHNSGLNKYRIKFLQGDGQVFYSSVQNYESSIEPVSFAPTRVSDKIYLSRETDYTVSDAKGNQLLKGHGKEIKLSHLTSGLYYLSIDNRTEKFYKK
jgi:hypothetical protein